VFTPEERLRQTIFTINSIQNAFPNSQIILLDSSDNFEIFTDSLKHIPNLELVSVKQIDSDAANIINSHPNKSLCESLMLNTYYINFKKYIKKFDFTIKTCGRYFYFNFKDYFTEENKDKIFFKKPLYFEWNDSWNYHSIDRRHIEKHNLLKQYCTVLYGFGNSNLEKFIDINEAVIHLIKQPTMSHYDIETLSYYLTRPFEKQIIEVDWKVSGWDGTSGRFMYY
jgi:hypothetical protein